MSKQPTPTRRTTDPKKIGQYGVANSAGPIEWYTSKGMSPEVSEQTFPTLKLAKEMADIESGDGWLGECWAFRWIPLDSQE